MKEQKSLSSQVVLDDVVFQMSGQRSGNRVTFAPSQGLLCFNPNVAEILGILKGKARWEQVLVGISKTTGIIVLKKCDPEEYGCSTIRLDQGSPGSFAINISHLVKNQPMKPARAYRYERNGDLIYLQAEEGTEVEI